jgi:hypothetical protein
MRWPPGTTAGCEMGGNYRRFDPVVSQYNQSGELFRIDGHCQSACTLFLAIHNVCTSRGATLFHAAQEWCRLAGEHRAHARSL